MFEYIKGSLAAVHLSKAIVDVHGLGYEIWIPISPVTKLPSVGQEVQFFTSLVIREDAHKLYGFLTRQERELFNQLTELSGIGPKTALALIGHLEIDDFQMAVAQANLSLICKVPGVGKKTAERLIIDMRDKLKDLTLSSSTPFGATGEGPNIASDAINALSHLGYNPLHAQKAVKAVLKEAQDPPELAKLITAALKII